MDFIDTVIGHDQERYIDFLTIHPRTRRTPSRQPINVEALQILTDKYGDRLPILVSGDVFTLSTLPYSSHLASFIPRPTNGHTSKCSVPTEVSDEEVPSPTASSPDPDPAIQQLPHIPKLTGLMSARAILANPALYAGHNTCPWEAVEVFMNNVVKAPLPLKLVQHHLTEMTSPGLGPDKRSLLTKKERMEIVACRSMLDLIDLVDDKLRTTTGQPEGIRRNLEVKPVNTL